MEDCNVKKVVKVVSKYSHMLKRFALGLSNILYYLIIVDKTQNLDTALIQRQ